MLACYPAGAAAHLGRGQRRGVVDKQGHILELADCGAQLGPVLLLEFAVTNTGLVDAANRRQHTNDE